MLLVMPASGAAGAIQGITTSALLDDVAAPGKLTGSYALLVSCGLAGSGAGYAIGGSLTSAIGTRNTFLAGAVAGFMTAGWYVSRRRTLQPRRHPPPQTRSQLPGNPRLAGGREGIPRPQRGN